MRLHFQKTYEELESQLLLLFFRQFAPLQLAFLDSQVLLDLLLK